MSPRVARLSKLFSLTLLLAGCSSPQPSFEDRRAAFQNLSGSDAFRRGDLRAAALHFERALEYARGLGDPATEADALINIGSVYDVVGLEERALEFYDQAESIVRSIEAGYPRGTLAANLNRSRILLARGETEAAKAALARAEGAAAELGGRKDLAACRKQAAVIAEREGRADDAMEAAMEAERLYAICARTPDVISADADAHLVIARLLDARGDHLEAVGQYKQAERTARETSDRTLIALALEGAGGALLALGRDDDARIPLRRAFEVNKRIPHKERALRVLDTLETIADRQGRGGDLEAYASERARIEALPSSGGAAALLPSPPPSR